VGYIILFLMLLGAFYFYKNIKPKVVKSLKNWLGIKSPSLEHEKTNRELYKNYTHKILSDWEKYFKDKNTITVVMSTGHASKDGDKNES